MILGIILAALVVLALVEGEDEIIYNDYDEEDERWKK